MTKHYRYDSMEGEMRINFDNGWWALTINGEDAGTYGTPEAAAYDVYAHNTGVPGWDDMENENAPEALEEWDRF